MTERAREGEIAEVSLQGKLLDAGQEQLTKDDYYTPKDVFDALGLEFDLDVSAPPGGVPWVPAKRYYTLEDDGLTQPWFGRVWMNPPYSNVTPCGCAASSSTGTGSPSSRTPRAHGTRSCGPRPTPWRSLAGTSTSLAVPYRYLSGSPLSVTSALRPFTGSERCGFGRQRHDAGTRGRRQRGRDGGPRRP